MSESAEFARRVTAVLRRYGRQQGATVSDAEAAGFVARLWELMSRRRTALRSEKRTKPDDAELADLAAHVAGPDASPLLADAARQLVKTCFYPEISACRDSYRAVSPDGTCRRQELSRTRDRISGAHCVDCPHWLERSRDEHVALLRREWRSDPAVFTQNVDLFLPDDYRQLRRWLHDADAL